MCIKCELSLTIVVGKRCLASDHGSCEPFFHPLDINVVQTANKAPTTFN